MRYTIRLRWNDTVVLHGTCSAAVAYATVNHFINDNFTNALHNPPTLRTLLCANVGQTYSEVIADETGIASYELECIAPAQGNLT